MNQVLRAVRRSDLRRKEPDRSSIEPGIQRPIANDIGFTLPAGPEAFAADKLGPVLIVRVSVTGPLPKARVRLAGAKLQVMWAWATGPAWKTAAARPGSASTR
jgi:hypothetical protein